MRSASFVAFAAVIVSGLGHLAFQFAPRPWSALGHIDIAALLTVTPIFSTHWPYWTFPFEYHPVIGWGSAILSYIAGELVLGIGESLEDGSVHEEEETEYDDVRHAQVREERAEEHGDRPACPARAIDGVFELLPLGVRAELA